MDCFLPSEVARLVLGYLKEVNCVKSWEIFLQENPSLEEFNLLYKTGKVYCTDVDGKSLLEILNFYRSLKRNCDKIYNEIERCEKEYSCNLDIKKDIIEEIASMVKLTFQKYSLLNIGNTESIPTSRLTSESMPFDVQGTVFDDSDYHSTCTSDCTGDLSQTDNSESNIFKLTPENTDRNYELPYITDVYFLSTINNNNLLSCSGIDVNISKKENGENSLETKLINLIQENLKFSKLQKIDNNLRYHSFDVNNENKVNHIVSEKNFAHSNKSSVESQTFENGSTDFNHVSYTNIEAKNTVSNEMSQTNVLEFGNRLADSVLSYNYNIESSSEIMLDKNGGNHLVQNLNNEKDSSNSPQDSFTCLNTAVNSSNNHKFYYVLPYDNQNIVGDVCNFENKLNILPNETKSVGMNSFYQFPTVSCMPTYTFSRNDLVPNTVPYYIISSSGCETSNLESSIPTDNIQNNDSTTSEKNVLILPKSSENFSNLLNGPPDNRSNNIERKDCEDKNKSPVKKSKKKKDSRNKKDEETKNNDCKSSVLDNCSKRGSKRKFHLIACRNLFEDSLEENKELHINTIPTALETKVNAVQLIPPVTDQFQDCNKSLSSVEDETKNKNNSNIMDKSNEDVIKLHCKKKSKKCGSTQGDDKLNRSQKKIDKEICKRSLSAAENITNKKSQIIRKENKENIDKSKKNIIKSICKEKKLKKSNSLKSSDCLNWPMKQIDTNFGGNCVSKNINVKHESCGNESFGNDQTLAKDIKDLNKENKKSHRKATLEVEINAISPIIDQDGNWNTSVSTIENEIKSIPSKIRNKSNNNMDKSKGDIISLHYKKKKLEKCDALHSNDKLNRSLKKIDKNIDKSKKNANTSHRNKKKLKKNYVLKSNDSLNINLEHLSHENKSISNHQIPTVVIKDMNIDSNIKSRENIKIQVGDKSKRTLKQKNTKRNCKEVNSLKKATNKKDFKVKDVLSQENKILTQGIHHISQKKKLNKNDALKSTDRSKTLMKQIDRNVREDCVSKSINLKHMLRGSELLCNRQAPAEDNKKLRSDSSAKSQNNTMIQVCYKNKKTLKQMKAKQNCKNMNILKTITNKKQSKVKNLLQGKKLTQDIVPEKKKKSKLLKSHSTNKQSKVENKLPKNTKIFSSDKNDVPAKKNICKISKSDSLKRNNKCKKIKSSFSQNYSKVLSPTSLEKATVHSMKKIVKNSRSIKDTSVVQRKPYYKSRSSNTLKAKFNPKQSRCNLSSDFISKPSLEDQSCVQNRNDVLLPPVKMQDLVLQTKPTIQNCQILNCDENDDKFENLKHIIDTFKENTSSKNDPKKILNSSSLNLITTRNDRSVKKSNFSRCSKVKVSNNKPSAQRLIIINPVCESLKISFRDISENFSSSNQCSKIAELYHISKNVSYDISKDEMYENTRKKRKFENFCDFSNGLKFDNKIVPFSNSNSTKATTKIKRTKRQNCLSYLQSNPNSSSVKLSNDNCSKKKQSGNLKNSDNQENCYIPFSSENTINQGVVKNLDNYSMSSDSKLQIMPRVILTKLNEHLIQSLTHKLDHNIEEKREDCRNNVEQTTETISGENEAMLSQNSNESVLSYSLKVSIHNFNNICDRSQKDAVETKIEMSNEKGSEVSLAFTSCEKQLVISQSVNSPQPIQNVCDTDIVCNNVLISSDKGNSENSFASTELKINTSSKSLSQWDIVQKVIEKYGCDYILSKLNDYVNC